MWARALRKMGPDRTSGNETGLGALSDETRADTGWMVCVETGRMVRMV